MTKDLAKQKCMACSADANPVTAAEIAELKPAIPDWSMVEVEGIPRLVRQYSFKDFQTALDFTNQVGAIAEAEGHHPVLVTEWGKTKVSWWSHEMGGLHRNDFIMAAKTDAIAQRF
ncbi:MAG: 4a-hydroxytetrahydrobiopterin dehydratase [Cyanobacteria bacterium P01_H01_bin.15]